eukprot:scaffold2731_cov128-Isochrysis_galbana.AAC.3
MKVILVCGNVVILGFIIGCALRFMLRRLEKRELAIQRALECAAAKSSNTATAAEILQSMSHNLTAVNMSDISPGESCSICLGDLVDAVERTCVKKEEAPTPTPEPTAGTVKIGAEEAADAASNVLSVQLDCFDATGDARSSCSAEAVRADDAVADGPALQSLPCGHCFHGQCLRGWIVHRGAGASCPLCKLELGVQSSPAVSDSPADRV